MPILARSEIVLAHFTDLLHDLYFPLPRKGLCPTNGMICIPVRDEERLLSKDYVSTFELRIYEVTDIEIEGRPDICPDPVQLNKIEYKRKGGIVVIAAVHPVRVKCRVQKLHLELEQIN